MANIAEKILNFAKSQGISQKYICDQLGVGNTYLLDAKRGKNRITPDRLAKIAEILHTTPEYLRDETDDPAPEQKEKTAVEIDSGLKEMNEIFNSLSPENRAKLLELSRLYLDAQSKNGENQ